MAKQNSNYKTDKQVNFNDAFISFASGMTSGLVCKSLTAPLSRLTILLQVQGAKEELRNGGLKASEKLPLNRPLTKTIQDLIQKEGITSFWKGNWTSIIHKAGATGVNYFTFEWSKNQLRPMWKSESDPGFLARTTAGFISGATSLAVAYPLDLVRTRLACDATSYHLKPGSNVIVGTLTRIYKEEGSRAFLHGLPCTMMCQGINIGLCFGIYETLNTSMLRNGATRTSMAETMGCGALTGLIASSIVHPFDLIRRRQQMCGKDTIYRIAQHIISKDGMRGLYRGLTPELAKVMPSVGLNFYIYEFVRQEIFRVKVNPR